MYFDEKSYEKNKNLVGGATVKAVNTDLDKDPDDYNYFEISDIFYKKFGDHINFDDLKFDNEFNNEFNNILYLINDTTIPSQTPSTSQTPSSSEFTKFLGKIECIDVKLTINGESNKKSGVGGGGHCCDYEYHITLTNTKSNDNLNIIFNIHAKDSSTTYEYEKDLIIGSNKLKEFISDHAKLFWKGSELDTDNFNKNQSSTVNSKFDFKSLHNTDKEYNNATKYLNNIIILYAFILQNFNLNKNVIILEEIDITGTKKDYSLTDDIKICHTIINLITNYSCLYQYHKFIDMVSNKTPELSKLNPLNISEIFTTKDLDVIINIINIIIKQIFYIQVSTEKMEGIPGINRTAVPSLPFKFINDFKRKKVSGFKNNKKIEEYFFYWYEERGIGKIIFDTNLFKTMCTELQAISSPNSFNSKLIEQLPIKHKISDENVVDENMDVFYFEEKLYAKLDINPCSINDVSKIIENINIRKNFIKVKQQTDELQPFLDFFSTVNKLNYKFNNKFNKNLLDNENHILKDITLKFIYVFGNSNKILDFIKHVINIFKEYTECFKQDLKPFYMLTYLFTIFLLSVYFYSSFTQELVNYKKNNKRITIKLKSQIDENLVNTKYNKQFSQNILQSFSNIYNNIYEITCKPSRYYNINHTFKFSDISKNLIKDSIFNITYDFNKFGKLSPDTVIEYLDSKEQMVDHYSKMFVKAYTKDNLYDSNYIIEQSTKSDKNSSVYLSYNSYDKSNDPNIKSNDPNIIYNNEFIILNEQYDFTNNKNVKFTLAIKKKGELYSIEEYIISKYKVSKDTESSILSLIYNKSIGESFNYIVYDKKLHEELNKNNDIDSIKNYINKIYNNVKKYPVTGRLNVKDFTKEQIEHYYLNTDYYNIYKANSKANSTAIDTYDIQFEFNKTLNKTFNKKIDNVVFCIFDDNCELQKLNTHSNILVQLSYDKNINNDPEYRLFFDFRGGAKKFNGFFCWYFITNDQKLNNYYRLILHSKDLFKKDNIDKLKPLIKWSLKALAVNPTDSPASTPTGSPASTPKDVPDGSNYTIKYFNKLKSKFEGINDYYKCLIDYNNTSNNVKDVRKTLFDTNIKIKFKRSVYNNESTSTPESASTSKPNSEFKIQKIPKNVIYPNYK
jgi:hypothetical protein